MKIMKTLAIAGLAAVSLGVGVANAQSLAPSVAQGTYYTDTVYSAPVYRGVYAGRGQVVQTVTVTTVPMFSDGVAGGF